MRRWAFNILAALSLLLFMATISLYLWTYSTYRVARFSRVTRPAEQPVWECRDFAAHRGTVQIGRMVIWNYDAENRVRGWTVQTDQAAGVGDVCVTPRPLGFGLFDKTWDVTGSMRRRTTAVDVPIWFLTLVSAGLPALWTKGALRRRRDRARAERGLCPVCGYDLRASEVRCPECGTPVPAKTPGAKP